MCLPPSCGAARAPADRAGGQGQQFDRKQRRCRKCSPRPARNPLAAAAAADTPKLLQGLVTFLCAMRGYLLDPVRYNPFDRACVLAVAEVVSGC